MKLLGMGIPELMIVLLYPVLFALFIFVLYWVIKKAVANGILEAREKIKEEEMSRPAQPE